MNTQSIQGVTFLQSSTAKSTLSCVMRLARLQRFVFRNDADAGNPLVAINGTDNFMFETDPVVLAGAAQTLTNKTLSTVTVFSAAPTINDGTKFTFSPNATSACINTGMTTSDPTTRNACVSIQKLTN